MMHAREKKSCRLKNRSSAVPTKTRSRGSPRSRPGRASTAPCAAHASTMSGKKMMDEMEAMAKKYNPFKVRHPRGVDLVK